MSRSRDKSKLTVDKNGDATVEALTQATPDQISSTTTTKTGYLELPVGSFKDRPATAYNGACRYNTDLNVVEYYIDKVWHAFEQGVENG